MKSLVSLSNELFRDYTTLSEYISTLISEPAENAYYRANQEIIYIGLINKIYSLWETFNKNIVYKYFELVKDLVISEGKFIERLRLHEMPGYITELGIYDDQRNAIFYDLKEEFITYTSRNIDANELNVLFKRFFNIDIIRYLNSSAYVKSVLALVDQSSSTIHQPLKLIIQERNSIAHQPVVSNFQSLPILINWISFFKQISVEICKALCNEYLNNNTTKLNLIGEIKKYYKNDNIIGVDIENGININTSTLLFLFKKSKLTNIYKPISFAVNNMVKESVSSNDKAGIKLESVFSQSENISPTNQIFVLQ